VDLVPEQHHGPIQKQIISKKKETALVLNKDRDLKIIVDGDKPMEVMFCPECRPQSGRPVIARS
jgi:hypothetical protein